MTRATALAAAWLIAAGCGDGSDGSGEIDSGPAQTSDGAVADATPGPLGSNCDHPFVVGPNDTHEGTTVGFSDDRTASCAGGTSEAPDVFYRMDLGDTPRDLVIDGIVDESVETPFDLVISARADCTRIDTELGCVDSGLGEHLELLAVRGELTVIVDGTAQYQGRAGGAYTLITRTREIVRQDQACDPTRTADRCETGTRCVGATCVTDSPALACAEAVDVTAALQTGSYDTTRSTFPFAADHHVASCGFNPVLGSGEDIFRFVLDDTVAFTATTDFPETRYDTVLYLREDDCAGPDLACQDDVDPDTGDVASTLEVASLPPGTYYLFVDGSSQPGTGTYRLRISVQ